METSTDRIGEIARRVAEHCRKAKIALSEINFESPRAEAYLIGLMANLQSEISRDAALLCAEEIISLLQSEMRSVPGTKGDDSPPLAWPRGEIATHGGLLDTVEHASAPVDTRPPHGGS